MLQLTTADSRLLVFDGELLGRKVSVLVDSGASTQFMAEALAKELKLTLTRKTVEDRVGLANGEILISRHHTQACYSMGTFTEKETFHLLPLASFDLVLGRPWLNRHNPDVDWPDSRIRLTQGPNRYELIARANKQTTRENHSIHLLNATEFIRTVKGPDEVWLVMLRSVDAGEAAKAEAENPSRKEAADCSPESQSRLQKLLKEYEDVVPTDPDFKFPFPKRALDFEIKMVP